MAYRRIGSACLLLAAAGTFTGAAFSADLDSPRRVVRMEAARPPAALAAGTPQGFAFPQLKAPPAASGNRAAAGGAPQQTPGKGARAGGPEINPVPLYYQEPGLSPNRDYVKNAGSEHIDPFTGKLQWHFVDLSIPGNGGFDLAVHRSYSSSDEDAAEPSSSGVGWTMHFGRLFRTSTAGCDRTHTSTPVFETPDGQRVMFYPSATHPEQWLSTTLWLGTCDAAGHFHLFSPDGIRYDLDVRGPTLGADPATAQNSWYPSRISDRNDNSLTIAYSSSAQGFGLATVTASDGRTLSFSVANGLVRAVTDGTRTVTYKYEGGYLTDVIRPDGLAWKYGYNPPRAGTTSGTMSRVTYPTGGVVEYTYDLVRFAAALPPASVVSTKVQGKEIWNFRYKPATVAAPRCEGATPCPFSADELDTTEVHAPDGSTTTYSHIGYTSAANGYAYAIGSLLSKNIDDLQIEGFFWMPLKISDAPDRRRDGLISDGYAAIPILWQHTVNRNGQNYETRYWERGFDPYGNPLRIVETGTDQRTTDLSWNILPDKWIVRQKKDEKSDIGTIARQFDPNGNLLLENRYGVPTSYTYTANGDVASKTNARGATTSYRNYKRGIPQQESQPEGISISRVVSDAGNVEAETDGTGATTRYTYDELNRITGIIHPIGNPVSVAYTADTRIVNRGDTEQLIRFDGYGREVMSRISGGRDAITRTYGYDALGRRVFESYPNSPFGTYRLFGPLGQLYELRERALENGNGAIAGRAYGYAVNTMTIVNERGSTFVQSYRGYGDPDKTTLMRISSPEPGTDVVMQRNGLDQITAVTQGGKSRTYAYDSRCFLTSQTDPELGTTRFGRDAVGNPTSLQVGDTPPVTLAYDGRNRVTAVGYPDGSGVTKEYYADDKLAAVNSVSGDGTVRRGFTYDANKNLTEISLQIDGRSFAARYAYDGNDALSTLTYDPGAARTGATISYNPDPFGRPTTALPYINRIAYHPTGHIQSMQYANGANLAIGLNDRQWPASVDVSSKVRRVGLSYSYDDAGNVSALRDLLNPGETRAMNYDAIDRLIAVDGPWGRATMSYDGRGNITALGEGANQLTYQYDAASDLLTEVQGAAPRNFAYDGRGNVTSNGVHAFLYDDASHLTCLDCGTADEVRYTYDGLGIRAKARKGADATYFMHDAGGHLLWETTAAGSYKEYVYVQGQQIAIHEVTP